MNEVHAKERYLNSTCYSEATTGRLFRRPIRLQNKKLPCSVSPRHAVNKSHFTVRFFLPRGATITRRLSVEGERYFLSGGWGGWCWWWWWYRRRQRRMTFDSPEVLQRAGTSSSRIWLGRASQRTANDTGSRTRRTLKKVTPRRWSCD